jgi:hypothetical protein
VPFANREAALDRRRCRFYVWGTLAFLAALCAFWSAKFVTGMLSNSAVGDVLPVGIVTLFCLLFGLAHEPAEKPDAFAYEAHEDFSYSSDGADLGAEHDEAALNRPENQNNTSTVE